MEEYMVTSKCLNCGAEMKHPISAHLGGTAPVICEECRKTYKPRARRWRVR